LSVVGRCNGQPHWLLHLLPALGVATGLLGGPAPAAEPDSPQPFLKAEVTLVGRDAALVGVKDVTAELLARDRVAVTWATRRDFQPQDIFERGTSNGVTVWIDLSLETAARLYFRDAGADRFFIRSLSLAQGIDEVAKEAIAHIVRNAVVALGHGGGEALTRSEARKVLQLQPAPEAAPKASATLARPLRFEVAAMAGAEVFARELPVLASAMVSLALTRGPHWGRPSGGFGGWLELGYQFPGRYQGSTVGVELQSMSMRAGVLWEIEAYRVLVFRIGFGAGADRIHYQPRDAGARVDLAAADTFYAPVVSLWAGMNVRLLDSLALTARLSVDETLSEVHFDLHDSNGQTSRLLVPYRTRPGAFLGLAFLF
jgi:hypothetical protein